MITINLPNMRLRNTLNYREHRAKKSARSAKQKEAAWAAVLASRAPRMLRPPFVVTVTRLGPRELDDDGASASAKWVRDGISVALGVDDGDVERIKFCVRQEKCKYYGVKIEIVGVE